MDQQHLQLPSSPASGPQTPPPSKRCEAAMSALEEFAIGCGCGFAGFGVATFQLTGWMFLFYTIFVPWLLLELFESYSLFAQVSRGRGSKRKRSKVQESVVRRKCLARQLFGQGVIMGSAAMDIMAPGFAELPKHSFFPYYAVIWLVWMVMCQYFQTLPTEDKVAVQRHLAKRESKRMLSRSSNSNHTSPSLRRTNSGPIVHASISPPKQSRRKSRRASTSCVPLNMA